MWTCLLYTSTTDLLLQMTLAATQIAQNTAPPVSDRTEDAGDRRDFSTLLAEKRVEVAGAETGRAVSESQKGEVCLLYTSRCV